MSVSEDKKQEYLDLISNILDNAEGADEGFQKVNAGASTLCDVNQVVNYNPQMTVVRDNGGRVLGYDYKYTGPVTPNDGALDVNSNNDSGSYGYATGGGGFTRGGGAGRFDEHSPARYVGGVNLDNDKIENTGFISGFINAAWGAVAALGKMGKQVGSAALDYLENINQDYEVSFGDFLTVSGNSGDTANALRVLFGLDKQGNTTMYMDEDVLGSLAILLKEKGFFDDASEADYDYDAPASQESLISHLILPLKTATTTYGYAHGDGSPGRTWGYGLASDRPVIGLIFSNTTTTPIADGSIMFFSKESFNVARNSNKWNNIESWVPTTYPYAATQKTTLNGTVYYFYERSFGGDCIGFNNLPVNITSSTFIYSDQPLAALSTVIIDGVSSGGETVPGISDQSGATSPVDAITGADPHVVGQNLYEQYPQVMGEPVLVNVMDDSCNQVTNRYFSIPITYSPTNLNVNAPITGTLQVDPSFNPDISLDPSINIDKLIDQIVLQLQGSGAGRDVVQVITDPDDPEEPSGGNGGVQTLEPTVPNTGTGVTPETELPQTDVHGMWHVYNPSSAEVSALGSWLWTNSIIEQIARMFNDPTNSIIGLHAIYGEPHVSSSAAIVVGNLTSTVSARVVSSQYTQVDCGEVLLTEYFGNVFDYAPYTDVSLFLPFIGIVSLDVADVMRARLQVVYNVDVYTGACVAQISVTRDGVGGVVYQYAGSCAISYPVSAVSYNNIFSSMVSEAMGVAALASGVGGLAGLGIMAGAANAAVNSRIAHVNRSGAFSGNAGALGSKKPYLIIRRPQTNMAINFERYDGRGSNFTSQLSQCTGYTKCKEVHLNIPGAYKAELDEIDQLLHEGVIL